MPGVRALWFGGYARNADNVLVHHRRAGGAYAGPHAVTDLRHAWSELGQEAEEEEEEDEEEEEEEERYGESEEDDEWDGMGAEERFEQQQEELGACHDVDAAVFEVDAVTVFLAYPNVL